MNTNEQGLLDFIKANPNSNKAAITAGLGIAGLKLFNQLKSMLKDGQIVSAGDGTEMTYQIAEPQTEEVVTEVQPIVEPASTTDTGTDVPQTAGEQANIEELPASMKENKEVTETKGNEQQELKATPAKATSTRDNTKYSLNGEGEYGKGPLARAVLELHLKKNPSTSYKQLKELFPDTLMKRFGVFEEITKAKEISGKTDRYFMKTEHVIKTGDKKGIVVCSQWTSKLIVPFIEAAKKLGYKIK